MKKIIDFKIEHIDFLGQGVDKSNDKVAFIQKVLPNETGQAEIYKENKKIQFAKVLKLEKKSPQRISSPCPHYDQCNGCQFLHTSYDNEIKIKTKNALFIFKNLLGFDEKKIIFHRSPSREHYRNRMQLHYNKSTNSFGMINSIENKIIEIPQCLLPKKNISKFIQEKYNEMSFLSKLTKEKGHIEIYEKNDLPLISFNKPYSYEGFTQVNKPMSELCKKVIFKKYQTMNFNSKSVIWDLFGGNGNLSSELNAQSYVVDTKINSTSKKTNQNHRELNLYDKNSVNKLLNELPHPDLIIIDPPRSGFKGLNTILKKYPTELIYLSCHPQTLKRDIESLSGKFIIKEIHIFDFFPQTRHFECLLFLSPIN